LVAPGCSNVSVRSAFRQSGFSFFFQAEDGIRDFHVTGVQTCALPICDGLEAQAAQGGDRSDRLDEVRLQLGGCLHGLPLITTIEIGRASCRERVEKSVIAASLMNNKR